MGISTKDAGRYIGYTQAEVKGKESEYQKPTLYFESGHLTQQYDGDTDRVGWHKNKGKSTNHVMVNAYPEESTLVNKEVIKKDMKAILQDVKAILKSKYSLKDGIEDLENMVLVEYDLDDKGNMVPNTGHMSRGELIKAEAKESKYNNTDAKQALTKAQTAKKSD